MSSQVGQSPVPGQAGRPEATTEGATGASAEPMTGPTTEPAVEPATESSAAETDLGRRRFFRRFASDVFQTAATVAGAATALQRDAANAANAILNPEVGAALLGDSFAPAPATIGGTAPAGFRTPFRFATDDRLLVIDQRRLPDDLVEFEVTSAADAAYAIREMIVRGAPAIGQVAAIGLALTAARSSSARPFARRAMIRGAAQALKAARPTAVNLGWAVDRMMARYEAVGDLSDDGELVARAMRDEGAAIVAEATEAHGRLAEFGLALMPQPEGRALRILTHCNTGPLACGQYGTALGIVQALHHAERPVEVWVDETRPYLQGARLTAWELGQAGVPHTVIADVAAGHLMARAEVDVVIVGADRVAANGDTANKIGTYTLAVLAARHAIPFYVCAPMSSVDLETPDGAAIEIEERPADEILVIKGKPIAPIGTAARNPAFDVTPAELISGIVTDEGALTAPFGPALAAAAERSRRRRMPIEQQARTA
jgi:methylthioribose-1-phosphate isomerase